MLAPAMKSAVFPWTAENELKEEFFAHARRGFFVEVGANDPEQASQTWHLEQLGWTGILIEPQPNLAAKLRRQRHAIVHECACSSPGNTGKTMPFGVAGISGIHSSLNPDFFVAGSRKEGVINVPVRTLDEILVEAHAPVPLDLLSIDVESHEIEVLSGLTLSHWRPRLILIEDLAFNTRLHRLLQSHGYKWIRRTGFNSWYVPADSAETVSLLGRWQFLRKHYLGVPFRHLRERKRRMRESFRQMVGRTSK